MSRIMYRGNCRPDITYNAESLQPIIDHAKNNGNYISGYRILKIYYPLIISSTMFVHEKHYLLKMLEREQDKWGMQDTLKSKPNTLYLEDRYQKNIIHVIEYVRVADFKPQKETNPAAAGNEVLMIGVEFVTAQPNHNHYKIDVSQLDSWKNLDAVVNLRKKLEPPKEKWDIQYVGSYEHQLKAGFIKP